MAGRFPESLPAVFTSAPPRAVSGKQSTAPSRFRETTAHPNAPPDRLTARRNDERHPAHTYPAPSPPISRPSAPQPLDSRPVPTGHTTHTIYMVGRLAIRPSIMAKVGSENPAKATDWRGVDSPPEPCDTFAIAEHRDRQQTTAAHTDNRIEKGQQRKRGTP